MQALDWTYRGLRTPVLENRYLRLVSLLDKGSDIIELFYKSFDLDLNLFPGLWFWQSYWKPDHPWSGKAYCIVLEQAPGISWHTNS